jgi:hypothetical protein
MPSVGAAAALVLVSQLLASCGGGGGGGYNERWLCLSQLGATETVTIGAGGASRTGSNQAGAQGGRHKRWQLWSLVMAALVAL